MKVIETKDGSKSIYLPDLNETYHSTHGALQESQHVYIKSGLDYLVDQNNPDLIKVFEMGFGTGLNAYLTADFARTSNCKIHYRTIEKYPLSISDHCSLGYSLLFPSPDYARDCHAIAEAPWGKQIEINSRFILEKMEGDFFEYSDPENSFDVLYFDAFGHRAQSELWEVKVFQICVSLLRKGGILVTYASKGLARRNMISAGFEVEKIPGPPGKREMMRATKL